jgi:nucleoside-diphosphate-sugar epimerase
LNSGGHIIVTGSSGFVGKPLVKRLRREGYAVIDWDIQQGTDVTNWDQIKGVGHFEAIIHLAARIPDPDFSVDSRALYRDNVLGTVNALELAKLCRAKMIFASTYVYGTPQYLPIDEDHPTVAFNSYGQSKLLGEALCNSYHRDFALNVIIMRPFNIYGLEQKGNFLIPHIIRSLKTGTVILKDPEPRRDFVHVDDVIEAYVRAVAYVDSGFEVFNIGCGKSYSVAEVVEIFRRCSQKDFSVHYDMERRKYEIPDTIADVRKAGAFLRWAPRVDMETGISSILDALPYEDR